MSEMKMPLSGDSSSEDLKIESASAASTIPTILVAEDDRLTRHMLCRALENENYKVIEVSNGGDCLESYQKYQPDLILLDAMMPMMTGLECCEKLSSLPSIKHTPVLIVTALEDEATVNWAFQVGATDYITKPINFAVLRHRVRLLIERSKLYRELESANKRFEYLATVDSLTQVLNRRSFDDFLAREWLRMRREKQPLSLILCDIDYFKLYNDTYGHLTGDRCLQRIANAIKQTIYRPADVVTRYGGEEFAVILSNTDIDGAIHVAQRIQANILALEIPHEKSAVSQYVTVSQGIAQTVPRMGCSTDILVLAADKALYQAKSQGRNRYCYQTV